MTEVVSIHQIQLLPLLSVTVGSQALLLDPDGVSELYDALSELFEADEDVEGRVASYDEGFEAGRESATFQRPTVWFSYGTPYPELNVESTRRNVIPVTVKMGLDDVLLVGIELSKGGVPHDEPQVKSYRTGAINDLTEGHPVSWSVDA